MKDNLFHLINQNNQHQSKQIVLDRKEKYFFFYFNCIFLVENVEKQSLVVNDQFEIDIE
jgi:hypothetical protein